MFIFRMVLRCAGRLNPARVRTSYSRSYNHIRTELQKCIHC